MRIVAIVLVTTFVAACTGRAPECPKAPDCPKAAPAQPAASMVPSFPLEALVGSHAKSAKLYVGVDGTLRKFAIHVERAGLPDWVHAMADKELGQGDEMEFEVEQYADGTQVYEVTRRVDGKQIELSVRAKDRTKYYVERKDLPLEGIPAPVRKAAEGIAGLQIKSYAVKERADGKIHQVEGERDGRPFSIHVADDGTVKEQRTELPAKVKIVR